MATDTSPPPRTVVGIGASAGGLGALRRLLADIPRASEMAWVVVVHLPRDHESHLADLLQPHCALPVQQVTDAQPLERGQVYVIPPGWNLETDLATLRLTDGGADRIRDPIDHFFRSLSSSHDGHAIGVVLTGSGSDGTTGLAAIKASGGLTVAQDPDEAEYDGMPRSAVVSGAVDRVLPIHEMVDTIVAFDRTRPRLPADDDRSVITELLPRIATQVRARLGHDFQGYKPSTLVRRIQRRMQLHRIEEPDGYLELLRGDPREVQELFDDLLISVTSFFRDEKAFERLERDVLPRIVEAKGTPHDAIRVWSVGCATGEEAYSLAILLLEQVGASSTAPRVQIFATDLSPVALQRAREGVYPASIEDDVSPERLRRFFVKEDSTYRIAKQLRELVVFAPHHLLQDPPFSRLDLLVCRNLLIYLQPEVQRKVVDLFHYALEPGGYLLLGSSETIERQELFTVVDAPARLYRRRDVPTERHYLPPFVSRRDPQPELEREMSAAARPARSYGALHEEVVERYAPPSILLSDDGRVLHYSAQAGRFLVHPGGEPTTDVFAMVRSELRQELRSGLHSARVHRSPTRSRPLPIAIDGIPTTVVVRVHPTGGAERTEGLFLVMFDELRAHLGEGDHHVPRDDVTVEELETELALTQHRLQAIAEEYETSQEEMKASNEELQSANEELRSTMEELETSKEELQSVNEELVTVNQENRHKVEELRQLSSDLQNLLISTDIATLFLDRDFRILRNTPRVSEVFSIRTNDRGRPISDLTHRLRYDEMVADAERVLDRLVPIEREIESADGRWFLTRVMPYRTTDDRIEGVVLTFIDITTRRRAEAELLELNEQLEQRVAAQTAEVRGMASTLSMAEHDVRRRVSQLLHDDLQQRLHALQLRIGLAVEQAEDRGLDELRELVVEVEQGIVDAIDVTRRLSIDLSPPILASEGLEQALSWLAGQMEDMHGLSVTVEADDAPELPDDERVFLFQVVRELLFNVVKHAETSSARVELVRGDGAIEVTVRDRGVGFDVDQVRPTGRSGDHIGLPGIEQRLSLVGGELRIRSVPGEGTQAWVKLPLGGERKGP